MTILPKSKKRLCVLLWLLLGVTVAFQNGNNFPAYLSGNNFFTGLNTFPSINGRILVDGTKYAATAAGIQAAIDAANTSGSREVWLPCGTIGITATLNIFHGGTRLIGCGTGKNDVSTNPSTLLIWTGGAAQQMVNICGKQTSNCTGASTNRIDGVELANVILDGNGIVTYTARLEKTDTSSFYNVRFRNGATASYYMVDNTGVKFYNVAATISSGYGMVFDWGTGGFAWFGGQLENDLNSSQPLLLLQGNQNNLLISGVEIDATPATFGGYIQINGFDTNSSFAGAPTGGAGAPNNVAFFNNSYVHKAGAGQPSQGTNPGADIFVSGTASANSQNIHFISDNFTGLAGTSKYAIEVDNTSNVTLYGVTSTNHTAAGGCTVNGTANQLFTSLEWVTSTDSARTCGPGGGVMADLQQAAAGTVKNAIGGFQGQSFLLSGMVDSATAPTISSGFGTSPSVANNNGTGAFTINVGTGGAASTGTIGLPTAAHAWACTCEDVTTNSATVFKCKQTGAGTTTTVPIGEFTAAGAAQAWTASDIVAMSCRAY